MTNSRNCEVKSHNYDIIVEIDNSYDIKIWNRYKTHDIEMKNWTHEVETTTNTVIIMTLVHYDKSALTKNLEIMRSKSHNYDIKSQNDDKC